MKELLGAVLFAIAAFMLYLILGGALMYFSYNTIVEILLKGVAATGAIPSKISYLDAISLYVAIDLLKTVLRKSKSDSLDKILDSAK